MNFSKPLFAFVFLSMSSGFASAEDTGKTNAALIREALAKSEPVCIEKSGYAVCEKNTKIGTEFHYLASTKLNMDDVGFLSDRKCLEAKYQDERLVNEFSDRLLTEAEYTAFYYNYPNNFEGKILSFIKSEQSAYDAEINNNRKYSPNYMKHEKDKKTLEKVLEVNNKTLEDLANTKKDIALKISKLKKKEKEQKKFFDQQIKLQNESIAKLEVNNTETKEKISDLDKKMKEIESINILNLLPETVAIINKKGMSEIYKSSLFEKTVKNKVKNFTGLIQADADKIEIEKMTKDFWYDYERNKRINETKKNERLKEIDAEISKIKAKNSLNVVQTDGTYTIDPKIVTLIEEMNSLNAPSNGLKPKIKVPEFKTTPVRLEMSSVKLINKNAIYTFYVDQKTKTEIEKKIKIKHDVYIYNLEYGQVFHKECSVEKKLLNITNEGETQYSEKQNIETFSGDLCSTDWTGLPNSLMENRTFVWKVCKNLNAQTLK